MIDDIWAQLEQENSPDITGYLNRRILTDVNYDVYIAINKPSNTRILMLRFKNYESFENISFPTSKSFVVNRVSLPKGEKGFSTLTLTLTDVKYKDIFTVLVADVIDLIGDFQEAKSAMPVFFNRLKKWQYFLEKLSPEGLSEAAQQGLYGELWFLEKLVIPTLGSLAAVQKWTGSKKTHQDFQFLKCTVEVKTTSGKQPQRLSIASERQLDNTGTGKIILFHLSLDKRCGQGETLPGIIDRLRHSISDNSDASREFENHLLSSGYLNIHRKNYEKISYAVREHNYFEVEENFPRIIESDLRPGVGDVLYTISVAECKKFCISESEVIELIETDS